MGNQGIGARLSSLMREAISNRRNVRRYPVTLPLKFCVIHQSRGIAVQTSRIIPAYTFDLSRNGLSIKTSIVQIDGMHISVSPDSSLYKILEIDLALPNRRIMLKGTPIRYELKEEKNGYIVGVKITAMPPDDRKLYEAYLKSLST